MQLDKLHALTLRWSRDRGITTNGKPLTQMVKLTEEVCETIVALSISNKAEVKDGVGDCCVVLTNLSELIGFTFTIDMIPNEHDNLNNVGKLIRVLGELSKQVNKQDYEKSSQLILEMFNVLLHIAVQVESSLSECWKLAYNEIKDRKGFLNEDGNFIKESDLLPGQVIEIKD